MHYLYHIARSGAPLSEGYIGVTIDPHKRFKRHLRNSHHPKKKHRPLYSKGINRHYDIRYSVIACGSEEEIYEKERELRPERNMGWNTIAGGYSSARI